MMKSPQVIEMPYISKLSKIRGFSRRGQLEISFQLIFSLILIAAFIVAAVMGIKYFLQTADNAKIRVFMSDLESKVVSASQATELINQPYELSLPTAVKYVCFSAPNTLTRAMLANITECSDVTSLKDMNMFFCPASAAWKVNAPINAYIDCRGKDCLEFSKNPYCIRNNEGKVMITLNKEYGAAKITLK